jgi:serine/threonine protein kinase
MIGKTISHYKMLEHIGEGGMCVVYKALASRLDRHVAIKFLPPELKSDKAAKARFIHEANAASALNHSNIAVVHDIDEAPDGQMFIVMAYYEGQTLRDKLGDDSVRLDEAIKIVSQIASGLAKAHEKEILHRDIKPANILITEDGEAKLADFGLAKLAGQTRLTKTGMTVGTVAYMSPEQAAGGDVDHRSDIFSLGVVLYELLTREVPFKGDHEAAVLYGIMHNDPAPLTKYRSDVSEGLQRVLDTVLHKDVDKRYQNATDLLADLNRFRRGGSTTGYPGARVRKVRRRNLTIAAIATLVLIGGYFLYSRYIGTTETTTARMMIAVLPFENLGKTEDEYFADGMTEEITARLAGVHALGVIARTSAMQYKNTDKNIQQIGEELGVDYILGGASCSRTSR